MRGVSGMHRRCVGMVRAGRVVLGTVLALMPLAAYPLGVGKLKVHSALNEPLNAEIDFTSISEKELKGLSVKLAPREDFDAVGAVRLPLLSQIKFIVSKRLDGRYFLHLQTQQPVTEPFLHFLIQLEWRGGRLVREYSALIDPPYYVAGRPTGIEVPKTPGTRTEPAPVATPGIAAQAAQPAPNPEIAAVERPPSAPPKRLESVPKEPEMVAQSMEALPAPRGEDRLLGPPGASPDVAISPNTGWPTEPPGAGMVKPLPAVTAESSRSKTWSSRRSVPAASISAYNVHRGDTVWRIAESVRKEWSANGRISSPRSISAEQLIMAIFEHNRHAFFANNVNNLKAGTILKVPEPDMVVATPVRRARREFQAQYDVWREYKLKLASASRTIKVADSGADTETGQTVKRESKPAKTQKRTEEPQTKTATKPKSATESSAKTEAPLPEKPASAARDQGKQPEELLKIVRATLEEEKAAAKKGVAEAESTKDTGAKERVVLADRVTTLEESLESKQMETKELGDKIGQVRSQIKNQSRLLELENGQLARAQTREAPPQANPSAKGETKPKAPSASGASKQEAPPKVAEAAPAKTSHARTKPKAAKTAPKRKPTPPPPQEKGILASLASFVGEDLLLPVVGGVLALLGGSILLIYLRRRRRSIAEFEESILSSEAISSEQPLTTDSSGQAVASGDTSFLSDFSQGGMGNIHTDEVDPIAEAEVYLAYGRDETAEEILKDAIVKNPERHELKQKLLEIYHQRNDVAAFETLAEELYAALGGRGGKIWERVEDMGRKLNPDNPMFRGGAPGGQMGIASAAAVTPQAPMTPPSATSEVDTESELDTPAAAKSADTAIDMDFDVGTVQEDGSSSAVTGLDFDLEPQREEALSDSTSIDFSSTFKAPEEPTMLADEGFGSSGAGGADDHAIDFHIGMGDIGEAPGGGQHVGADETEIKWDVEAPAAAEGETSLATEDTQQQQWDETATKLDLAKAYIDMGDSEGARSILDEVLAEGNENQKKQAAALAAQIA